MKLCAACHQDLPKDKFSKKQWKLGAVCQRQREGAHHCVRDNREVVQPPPNNNNESANNNNRPNEDDAGIVSLLESMSMNDNEIIQASDEELFKQPPQNYEDCPICFLHLPCLFTGHRCNTCCGKIICSGCSHANDMIDDEEKCPFCRTPAPTTDEESIKRIKKRVDLDDAQAIYNLGCDFSGGRHGLPQNRAKAIELWHRAGELGESKSYHNIGNSYFHGDGMERDMKKAKHYWELAAMGGDPMARHNLGVSEEKVGNFDRALKHWIIAARSGVAKSFHAIKELYMRGDATEEDYGTALRAHQSYLDEVRSDQRDEAAAYDERYKYY